MKVELHSHTDVFSSCSRIAAPELIAMAEASGYDAVFVTDHNKVWPAHDLAALREHCERVRVLPGIEIALPDNHDILVLGAESPIYESLHTPSEVLAQACADGYLTVLAHPFRWHDALPEYCGLLDAIEVYTCNHPEDAQAAQAVAYAAQHNMAPVYSSDAHGLNFMNRFWIETDEPFDTPQELRRAILAGRYENRKRQTDAVLPPPFKAGSMAELAEEDLAGLYVQPTL
ncbi:MAG: hypothetical protein JXR94_20700 [Candidatus Hydrogenedentes bacterium]|nr:hypothetical protein [Candidatus Hydrogenedentota bacterium]